MTDDVILRRQFLVGAGALAAALSPATSSQTAAAQAETLQADSPAVPADEPMLTLTPTEHAFIAAAVDTLIPADELSPSGSACGVDVFIDRQLASAWGGGARMYRSGPFHKGKPEQGYQLALTPREFFASGIIATNEWTRTTYGKDFDRLAEPDRIATLEAMQSGKAEFHGFSSRGFFAQLLNLAHQGFFSDPVYGGNRNMASWKMLGFPGLPATYANKIDAYHDKKLVMPPQSIADFS
ncbi:MAG: gluconate 2-dehydrogenase [Bradyrhizobium sp.]|jgi:gluconate 2-dehydrogenase gamma chain|nr:gluconate 2-dehydrogenase [Bradyrhizobium sp.]